MRVLIPTLILLLVSCQSQKDRIKETQDKLTKILKVQNRYHEVSSWQINNSEPFCTVTTYQLVVLSNKEDMASNFVNVGLDLTETDLLDFMTANQGNIKLAAEYEFAFCEYKYIQKKKPKLREIK
jgi:hypothetical protein